MDDYEKVLKLLAEKYDWNLFDSLTPIGKKLVKDTLEANKEVNYERQNPVKESPKNQYNFSLIIKVLIVLLCMVVLVLRFSHPNLTQVQFFNQFFWWYTPLLCLGLLYNFID